LRRGLVDLLQQGMAGNRAGVVMGVRHESRVLAAELAVAVTQVPLALPQPFSGNLASSSVSYNRDSFSISNTA
jgi:hypothetical protein